jgi:hypothetical protein
LIFSSEEADTEVVCHPWKIPSKFPRASAT